MTEIIEPIIIKSEKYYSIKQFAFLTGLTSAAIGRLINKGNRFGKLKAKTFHHISHAPFILASEYTNFIFMPQGRPSDLGPIGYKYNKDGELYEVTPTELQDSLLS